ncbi:hypothetical protein KAR91_21520 [Candidatus Pacearchaeota archaeon]|nr:hypothetical protein [Candidatus Pacearchaeota archaeon]
MFSHRQHIKAGTKKRSDNSVKARLSKIEDSPPPDYPENIDSRENYVYIYIEQHSQRGVKIDCVDFYMDNNRINSWNIKHNGYMQIHESGKRLFRAGTHRALAWIARNIFTNIGRHDG